MGNALFSHQTCLDALQLLCGPPVLLRPRRLNSKGTLIRAARSLNVLGKTLIVPAGRSRERQQNLSAVLLSCRRSGRLPRSSARFPTVVL